MSSNGAAKPPLPSGPPPESVTLKRKLPADRTGSSKAPKVLVRQSKAAPAQKPEITVVNDLEGDEVGETPVAPSSPSSSPPPGISKKDSWKEFSDVDPLYAIKGELSVKKIYDENSELDEERLTDYLTRLFEPGVVKKPKDWIEIWASMLVPVQSQADVIRRLLEVGLESEIADEVSDILAELVKGHRVKIKGVEEAIVTLFECGADQHNCLMRFMLLIFPKSPTTEWGWSRVGWSWQQWWSTSEKILQALDTSSAFEVLCELLRNLESESGTYLPHQQIWDEKRLSTIRAALCRYGNLQEDELPSALDVTLV
eukprot:TRINITY_DN103097_c0_g1_i1.p1 TRINITY_DN103097_c0_g1~~TRINITY_DN103097_c0_g1_i1.p1  ORF type:complete len:346 (-),score=80.59 TRINITY_DN103097_c0_g1_i1:64-1002(-)